MNIRLRFTLILAVTFSTPCLVVAQEGWTLQRCIDYALGHNLTLQQSELNLERLELNRSSAVGQMLPNLNGSASHGYNWGQTIDPFTNSFATERIRSNSFGLSTQVSLFSGFRMQNQLKQTASALLGGRADLEKAKNDIALNIASSYLTVLLNRELLATAVRNRSITEEQVRRMEKLVDAGQFASGSLNELQATLAGNDASVVGAQNNLDLSMLSLKQMLQLSPEEMASFDIATPDASDAETIVLLNSAETIVQAALTNQPQVKSAQAAISTSEYDVRIARGASWPSLGASFSYGTGYSGASLVPTGDPYLSDPFPIGYVDGTLTPVLSYELLYPGYDTKPFGDQVKDNVNQSLFFSLQMPIFNGFSTRNSISQAEIGLKNAEIGLELTRQQLTQEVELAYADAKAAKANYDAAKVAVHAAEKAFDFSRARFEQGVIQSTEFSQIQTQLLNARASEIQYKYEFLFRARILDFYQGNMITLK